MIRIERRIRGCISTLCQSATLVCCVMSLTTHAQDVVDKAPRKRGLVIELTGGIHGLREQFLRRKLQVARKQKVDLVVLHIDSPGGELQASLDMAQELLEITDLRTVALISHQALSGAAIVSLACDEIAMTPDARIGDAGPIFMDRDFLFKHAPEKVRSDLVSRVRDLAEQTGRPAAIAEAMVDMDAVVYRVKHRDSGATELLTNAELASRGDAAEWERLEPVLESQEGRFLELIGRRAVELGLAERMVDDRTQLLEQLGLAADAPVLSWTQVDTVVLVLNQRWVTVLLFVLALLGLMIELSSPGLGVGGVICTSCFALFFWSRMLGGTAVWLEIVLFLVGVLLILTELFVIPGFGIWGLTGLVFVVASLVLAGQSFVMPHSTQQWRLLTESSLTVIGTFVACGLVAIFAASRMETLPIFNFLALKPPSSDQQVAEDTPAWQLIPNIAPGTRGTADSPLRPAGRMRWEHQVYDVTTQGEFIERGAVIVVLEVRGKEIVVRKAPEVNG